MRRQNELKAEHKAPITKDCYIPGKLLDGTDVRYHQIQEQVNHI